MTDVSGLEGDEIAAAKPAVDTQVEEREIPHPPFHLQADTQRPDVFHFEGCLLADDLAFVPRLAVSGIACGSHDGLHQVEGHPGCAFCRGRAISHRKQVMPKPVGSGQLWSEGYRRFQRWNRSMSLTTGEAARRDAK
jgi:hypothetical protein